MHDLKAERFYKKELANGMMMAHDGPIKTFPLRGIKDSPLICTTEDASLSKIQWSILILFSNFTWRIKKKRA
jgi:hypothetical protein